jgi:hypothetical protein
VGGRHLRQTTNPSQIRRPGRSRVWLFLALSCLLGGGCGLDDYEAKIRKDQLRLEFFDDEYDKLGSPPGIDPPKSEDKDKYPVPAGKVVLRQPQEIDEKCASKPVGMFYDYPRKSKGKIRHLYLAWDEKAKAKEFRDKVFAGLEAFHVSVSQKALAPVRLKERPPPRKPPPPFEAATYDTKETDANKVVHEMRYFIYLYPEATEQDKDKEAFQVAIIFVVDLDPLKEGEEPASEQRVNQTVKTEIDYCLGTLSVGSSPTSQQSVAPDTGRRPQ